MPTSIRFVNQRILEIIQKIQSELSVPPLIILQGDHSFSMVGKDQEAFKILNAYYLPNGGNDKVYANITPVNTFRLIFSYYFHADYSFIPDELIWLSRAFPTGAQIVPRTCVQ